jgi:GNAT superfamily N-acetyltransferase
VERLETTDFAASHLDAAAILLAARHRAHRAAEPLLAPRFEEPAAAAAEVAALLEQEGASGAVAFRGTRGVGYLLGTPRGDPTWGPNVWVEAAGHAVEDAEVARDLYARAAARWVEEGRTAHYVIVPATDAPLVDAWFRLGFGQQQVHALREPPAGPAAALPPGVSIRRAARGDVSSLAGLDLVLPEHQGRAPVFSPGASLSLEAARADWEESIEDPAYATFVAEIDGRVVGSAIGCSVELSRAHRGVARPPEAALLGFAAVHPAARGRGVGRALGQRVLEWAAEAGCRAVVTDWRATNLLASRTWPRLGFRPTFLRLFRAI